MELEEDSAANLASETLSTKPLGGSTSPGARDKDKLVDVGSVDGTTCCGGCCDMTDVGGIPGIPGGRPAGGIPGGMPVGIT